jgi:hypothetical protein
MNSGNGNGKSSQGRCVEEAIFATLEGVEISVPELLSRVGGRGLLDQSAVKAALTRLLAGGRVEMTPNRRIHVPLIRHY